MQKIRQKIRTMMQERRKMVAMMMAPTRRTTDDVQPEEAAGPKKRHGPIKAEPPAAAPVRRQTDSAGDQGTQNAGKPKRKAACEKKSKPE